MGPHITRIVSYYVWQRLQALISYPKMVCRYVLVHVYILTLDASCSLCRWSNCSECGDFTKQPSSRI